jgi:hypothetical protein
MRNLKEALIKQREQEQPKREAIEELRTAEEREKKFLHAYEWRLEELGIIFGPGPGTKHIPEQAEFVRTMRDQETDHWFNVHKPKKKAQAMKEKTRPFKEEKQRILVEARRHRVKSRRNRLENFGKWV